jgi:hypothetical protein
MARAPNRPGKNLRIVIYAAIQSPSQKIPEIRPIRPNLHSKKKGRTVQAIALPQWVPSITSTRVFYRSFFIARLMRETPALKIDRSTDPENDNQNRGKPFTLSCRVRRIQGQLTDF